MTNTEHKIQGSNVGFIIHEKEKADASTEIFDVCDTIPCEHLERKGGRVGRREEGGKGGRERKKKLTFMGFHVVGLGYCKVNVQCNYDFGNLIFCRVR